jgi:hypothetical protein
MQNTILPYRLRCSQSEIYNRREDEESGGDGRASLMLLWQGSDSFENDFGSLAFLEEPDPFYNLFGKTTSSMFLLNGVHEKYRRSR